MDITNFVNEYAAKERYYGLSVDADIVHTLIKSNRRFAFTQQECHENSEYLEYSIKSSVAGYDRDKKVAIEIYKHFLKFLREKGVDNVDIRFPKIDISNSFERQMFIAKYFHDPRHNPTTAKLSKILWVSEATIRADLRKLLGEDDPIQVCGRKFVIDGAERRHGTVLFDSTPHPIFLTHNLSQVIVMLKGLKAMSENPLYKDYALTAATDIWEQLSDYAKTRIYYVLSELLSEDPTWYKNLIPDDAGTFRTERQCGKDSILPYLKSSETFFVAYETPNGVHIYRQCICLTTTQDGRGVEVNCTEGHVCLDYDTIIKTADTAEGLL